MALPGPYTWPYYWVVLFAGPILVVLNISYLSSTFLLFGKLDLYTSGGLSYRRSEGAVVVPKARNWNIGLFGMGKYKGGRVLENIV